MLQEPSVHRILRSAAVTVLALAGTFSLYSCGTTQLASTWQDHELYTDRDSTEWQQAPAEIEDKLSLALSNDADYLYLSLTTHDREIQRKILLQGLTVWFDRGGGKEKRFGIRYPLGLFGRGFGSERPQFDSVESNPRERFAFSQSELEIIGPGEGERQRFPIKGAKGIDVKIDNTAEKFHYRLKVPLWDRRDHPFAVVAKVGETIGVGIETGNPERELLGRRATPEIGGRPGSFPGGGRRGGTPPGGFGGRQPQGNRQALLTPIKTWVKVQLATSGSVQQQ